MLDYSLRLLSPTSASCATSALSFLFLLFCLVFMMMGMSEVADVMDSCDICCSNHSMLLAKYLLRFSAQRQVLCTTLSIFLSTELFP